VGYYYLDTTTYENGVHTIVWSAEDSAGVGTGLGSRYFIIQNTGGAQGEAKDEGASRAGISSLKETDIAGVVPSMKPVYVKKGYNQRAFPQEVYPDENGVIHVEINEVERVALSLNLDPSFLSLESLCLNSNQLTLKPDYESEFLPDGSEFSYIGHLRFQDELRPLPIGFTLNSNTGVFTWQPGPGFLGEYEFVFIRKGSASYQEKIRVKITIKPKFEIP